METIQFLLEEYSLNQTIKTCVFEKRTSLRKTYSEYSFVNGILWTVFIISLLYWHFIPYGKCSRHFNCIWIENAFWTRLTTTFRFYSRYILVMILTFNIYFDDVTDENNSFEWNWNLIVTLTHGQSLVNTSHACFMSMVKINPFNNMLPIRSFGTSLKYDVQMVFGYLLGEKQIVHLIVQK